MDDESSYKFVINIASQACHLSQIAINIISSFSNEFFTFWFEGATQAYVHEADTISMLLAEQEVVKVARKKYRYVEVKSLKSIG